MMKRNSPRISSDLRLIGNWLKRSGKRQDMVIATKVGMEMAPDRKGLSAGHITRWADESLQRLQTDYIGLYFSHCDDATVPMNETLGAYQRNSLSKARYAPSAQPTFPQHV